MLRDPYYIWNFFYTRSLSRKFSNDLDGESVNLATMYSPRFPSRFVNGYERSFFSRRYIKVSHQNAIAV